MKNHSLNIRGYLKLSMDNDPRVELKFLPEFTNCIMPSQIKVQYKQLKIYE